MPIRASQSTAKQRRATAVHFQPGPDPCDSHSQDGDALPPTYSELLPGVDLETIHRALRRVGAGEDGTMGLEQFQCLYQGVFSGRPMDALTWKLTEELFDTIDKSGDGEIDLIELLSYLSQPIQPVPRPTTLAGWLWVIIAPFGAAGNYDPRLSGEPGDRRVSWIMFFYKAVSQIMIITNLVVLLAESLPSMQRNRHGENPGDSTTFGIELVTVVWFSLEMVAYMCLHPRGPLSRCLPKASSQQVDSPLTEPVQGEEHAAPARHAPPGHEQEQCCTPLLFDPIIWVDLFSIVPFYVELGYQGFPELKSIVATRYARLLRLLKVIRTARMLLDPVCFVARMPKLVTALRRSAPALMWLAVLIFVLLSVSSAWIYFAERDEAYFDMATQEWVRDPSSKYSDAGTKTMFQSIPASMWWAVVTITTVGYGDFYPVTDGGKFIGGITILSGLIIVAFPITILGSVFQTLHDEQQAQDQRLGMCRDFYLGCRKWFATGGEVRQRRKTHYFSTSPQRVRKSPASQTISQPDVRPCNPLAVAGSAAAACPSFENPSVLAEDNRDIQGLLHAFGELRLELKQELHSLHQKVDAMSASIERLERSCAHSSRQARVENNMTESVSPGI
eukprot:TRINITY_DN4511_c0_g1_i1.p1 TRINITY_DN4511_c0_g1~~TRINITY_DN4511_c0_g1_i1.p1  ORF type:complete len:646 (+),score=143.97 TRINITY_DN4511_c0_g1_i1:88-1938(+)